MYSRPLCSLSMFSVLLIGLCTPVGAELVITSSNNASGFFSSYNINFSNVTATAGDYIVVAHTNSFPFDNFSVSDSVTISDFGTDVFTALSSGDTGEDESAWIFYTPVESIYSLKKWQFVPESRVFKIPRVPIV